MIPTPHLDPFYFDVDTMLEPIPGDNPAGESLRYEGTYDRIVEARRHDDPAISQGVWKTELKKADWPMVEELCLDAIQRHSKDLQIAAWLSESWLHLHGFAGVREGLRLQKALCERFWDSLYPAIEDSDYEFRIAPIHWLNEKVAVALSLVQITWPHGTDEHSYCFADWETACRLAIGETGKRPAKSSEQQVTQAKFQQSVALTPTDFFVRLTEELESAHDAIDQLEGLLTHKLGDTAPSLYQFEAAVEAVEALIGGILAQRGTDIEPVSISPDPEEDLSVQVIQGVQVREDRVRSRAEAYRLLAEAADYLIETEPHSPTPYLVRRAIAWGTMRLDELLTELVRNDGELSEIFRLLRMDKPRT
jgi:type VI secretion system protein ImpA